MCAILGIIIFEENKNTENESAKVIVSNHVSVLDHLVLHLLHNSFSINFSELPPFFHHALNYKDLGNCQNVVSIVQNVKSFISNDAIIDIQPEDGITSGEKGLLR